MPIQLKPITRREFLSKSTAAGAALLAGRQALRSQPARPATEHWAWLADTHIAADRTRVERKVNMADNLEQSVAAVARAREAWSGILINGDCAFRDGQPGDYEVLKGLIDPLRAHGPMHLTLGNHDDRQQAHAVLAGTDSPVPNRHVAFVRGPQANWLFLDSLDQVNSTPGLLGEFQLKWLADTLDQHPDQPALVVAHHNLERGETRSALKDTAQLLEIIEPRRQVKAYIFGHTHHWTLHRLPSGLHQINLPPVAYLFNNTDPNGWIEASIHAGGCRLQLHCLEPGHALSERNFELSWRT